MVERDRNRSGSAPEPSTQVGIFARTGEFWTIGFAGTTFSLKDIRGFRYIERLLRHPGEEFHVLDLASEAGTDTTSPIDTSSVLHDFTFGISHLGDSGEMLDARARQDYKCRLHELRKEFEDLQDRGAHEQAAKVEFEIEFLEREIARAVGLGGRNRRAGSAAERARLNVTRLIRTGLQKISEHNRALGELLDRSIKTGSFCSYFPDPRTPISWLFSLEATTPADEIRSPAPLLHRNDTYFQGNFVRRTTFVGRETERARLRGHLDRVLRGIGAVVMIAGAAGVGKTRIAAEFSLEASEKGVLTLVGACYDRDDPLPFVPFVEMLEPMLAASSLADVREALGEDIAEIGRLLPQLRRLFPDIPPSLELPPEQSRWVLFNAVARVLTRTSTKQPVLLVLDDLHWADEGTLSLLTHLAPLVSKIPVLIVGTYRDFELQPARPLAKAIDELIRHHVLDQLSLSGLQKPEVAKMIEAFGGRKPPEEVANLIYSETEGNPFFIEELLQHLVEQNQLLDRNGEFRRGLKLDELNVPRTVRLGIERRIARLSNGAQKSIATAAVIGRAFTFELLQESSHADVGSLLDWIEEAEKAGLIGSTLQYPEVHFRFCHEQIRQTVACELSSIRRQRLHLDIADAIERLYANTLQDHIDDLAHHLWEAGRLADVDRITNCLTIAAKQASLQGAYEATIRYLRNGLDVTKRLPPSFDRLHKELNLYVDLRDPLIATKGYLDPEVEIVCTKARDLLEQLGDAPEFFSVLGGLTAIYFNRGELRTAQELAEKMLGIATKSNNPVFLLWAHYALGFVFESQGEYMLARQHFEQSLALYDRKLARAYGFVQDPGATAFLGLAFVVYRLGYPDLALKMVDDGIALAREIGDPFTLALVLGLAGEILMKRGDELGATTLFEEGVALCTKHGLEEMLGEGIIRLGWALACRGSVQEGIAHLLESRAKRMLSFHVRRGMLALAYGRAGRVDEGLRIISETLIEEEKSERGNAIAWFHQINGELLLMCRSSTQAEECFHQAIAAAQRHSDKSQELAATTNLARLVATRDRRRAYAMLSAIYGWFSEGFDTTELKAARTLLDELKR